MQIGPVPVDEPTKADHTGEKLAQDTPKNMATKALSDVSHDIVEHPNLEASDDSEEDETYLLGKQQNDFAHSRFVKWFAKFDERRLRPFFIRNYTIEMVHSMHHMHELMTKNFDDNDEQAVTQAVS